MTEHASPADPVSPEQMAELRPAIASMTDALGALLLKALADFDRRHAGDPEIKSCFRIALAGNFIAMVGGLSAAGGAPLEEMQQLLERSLADHYQAAAAEARAPSH